MRTHCPSCSAVLNVTEDILNVANGKVRCGDCNEVFNGYDHLEKTDKDTATVLTSEKQKTTEHHSFTDSDLDGIEAELSSLDESFETSSLQIDKTTKPTSSPKIDLSFKATSPDPEPTPDTSKTAQESRKIDINLSKKVTEKTENSAQRPHKKVKPARVGNDVAENNTPNNTHKPVLNEPKVDLPEIDLDLDAPEQNPEAFGVEVEEVIASDSSIDDIINKFMGEGAPSQNELDTETSHAMEMSEMIAESGIIIDAQDDDDSFKELMDELNQEQSEAPSAPQTKQDALAHALSDHASPEDDIFAGLTGVDLDGALSTRATDEAIKALFPVREEDNTASNIEIDSEPEEDLTEKTMDIEQGINELFGSDEPSISTTDQSLLAPKSKVIGSHDTKPKKTKDKKIVSKKLKALGALGCILLLLGFFAQALYAARYTLAQNPKTSTLAVQACKYIPFCELRKPKSYTLISKEITPHPILKDVQVLDITLKNTANFEQPLPSVFVSMTDQMNKQIARNTFTSSEYEPDNPWVKSGETRSIQILLNNSDARITGFEIDFQ